MTTPSFPTEGTLEVHERVGTPAGERPSHARLLEKVQLDPVTQQPVLPEHLRGAAMHGGARRDGDEVVDVGRLTREQKQAISTSSMKQPKPAWLKVRLPGGGEYSKVTKIVREQNLVTVCEEARCPNIGECWGKGTATFQILGDVCTRACRYCGVATGRPENAPDPLEPGKLAHAVEQMGIQHAVITSVDRDDLDDRGAGHWATTIEVLRRRCPGTTIEVLTPDFMGVEDASMRTVIAARPDVFSHNTETVRRLYRRIRPRGDFDRAMWVLRAAKELAREFGQPPMMTKTGVIAGMGETIDELKETLVEIREQGVDVVTIGQYLRPTIKHLPVDRYYAPAEFDELRDFGMSIGFGSVFSGPLVRSSYKAEEQRFAAMDPSGDATRALTSGAPVVPQEHIDLVGVVPDWKR